MYGDKVLNEDQAKGTPVSQWTGFSDSFHIIIRIIVFLKSLTILKRCFLFLLSRPIQLDSVLEDGFHVAV